jgi:hypothetical protein
MCDKVSFGQSFSFGFLNSAQQKTFTSVDIATSLYIL